MSLAVLADPDAWGITLRRDNTSANAERALRALRRLGLATAADLAEEMGCGEEHARKCLHLLRDLGQATRNREQGAAYTWRAA